MYRKKKKNHILLIFHMHCTSYQLARELKNKTEMSPKSKQRTHSFNTSMLRYQTFDTNLLQV